MPVKFKLDTRQVHATVARLKRDYKLSAPRAVNQIALDIVGAAFDAIPPTGDGNNIQAKRAEIKLLLNQQLATRVKRFKSGKRKGQFGRAVGRARELYAKNLIANYWRGRQGKKGLYGTEMKRYSGALAGRRQIGVGSLKVVFIPIIRALNRVCKFKFPFSKTSRISRWPGSRGDGIATLAETDSTKAAFSISYKEKSGQSGPVMAIYNSAMRSAFETKKAHMMKDVERELAPAVAQANRG